MTGVIRKDPCDKHLRVVLDLDGDQPNTLYFQDTRRFGRFLFASKSDYSFIPTLHNLGPEPLSKHFTATILQQRLTSRTALKAALLSQRPVAGLGNIYVDESLWIAKIHPLTPANQLTRNQSKRLHEAIVTVLTRAIDSGGTTLNDYRKVGGDRGEYQHALIAYGRTGQPCPRCATSIERIVITQRSTHFCPKCQTAPRTRRSTGKASRRTPK